MLKAGPAQESANTFAQPEYKSGGDKYEALSESSDPDETADYEPQPTASRLLSVNDLEERTADKVNQESSPASLVEPVIWEAEVSKPEASEYRGSRQESSVTAMRLPMESGTADLSEQRSEQLNPFQQLGGLSNLMSQLMPGFFQDAGFDVREMQEKFSGQEQTGSFANIEVKPGGADGELSDTLPVPADLQSIWQQMNAIDLPEVTF